jgi:hypothetical protein
MSSAGARATEAALWITVRRVSFNGTAPLLDSDATTTGPIMSGFVATSQPQARAAMPRGSLCCGGAAARRTDQQKRPGKPGRS